MTLDSHQDNAYSDVEATLAQAFANEATIALENARLFQELQTLATFDQLTGIWNRRHFFHLAKIEFQRARRHRQPLSAILFDLDTFKTINDTYGHAVGDQVLRGVAQVCKNNLRQIDILGRYGGEEFMVLLPNTPLASALLVAERLCGIIAATPYETERGAVHVSASFGIAETDQLTQDIDTLLKYADRAAYISKNQGKNRVTILDDPNAP
jgi:diguanylate cyclase (GGDEF)-like protein